MRRLLVMAVGALLMVGCGGGATGGGGGSGGGGGGSGGGGGPTDFPTTAVFYQDISGAAVDSESSTIMSALQSSGWGGKLRVDVSFAILHADASVAPRPFSGWQGSTPDCDTAPVPVPPSGHTEGVSDYACSGGDCHMLVYQGSRLYELYQADITGGQASGGTFTGTCLVVWDLSRDYWANPATVGPGFARGDGCNGSDAGDVPIAPLLLRPDEIKAGAVNHAMRFTLDNGLIRSDVYVHPATHIGGPTGGADTLPYGSRLRLKASFDESTLPSEAAKVVARALKKYGMFLADGGNPYISATDDVTDAIAPTALTSMLPSDFEMVEGGTRINWHQQDCTRTPVTN